MIVSWFDFKGLVEKGCNFKDGDMVQWYPSVAGPFTPLGMVDATAPTGKFAGYSGFFVAMPRAITEILLKEGNTRE